MDFFYASERVALRNDLNHRSCQLCASVKRGAVDIACIHGQSIGRVDSIGAVEVEVHTFSPAAARGGGHLENDALSCRTAFPSSAVQISEAVEDNSAVERKLSVRPRPSETVKHTFGPSSTLARRELKHRAFLVGAATARSAV